MGCKYIFIIFSLISLIPLISAQTQIDSCEVLNIPNMIYELNQTISTTNETCFTIEGENITLDGLGNSITGDLSLGDYGIFVNQSNNVTIKNLRIYNFGDGVYLNNTEDSTISNITVTNNTNDGIILNSGSKNKILSCTSSLNNWVGIEISDSVNNTFENNNIVNNHFGMAPVFGATNSVIKNNTIQNNKFGIYIEGSPAYNILIENNTLNSNEEIGIYISECFSCNFLENKLNSNGEGIQFVLLVENNYLSGGFIKNSKRNALYIDGPGAGTQVKNNTIKNIKIENTSDEFYDLRAKLWTNGQSPSTLNLKDMKIRNYSFQGSLEDYGPILSLETSEFGQIEFLDELKGSGTNLSRDIRINNNSVTVESEINSGLNKPANITLLEIGNRGFSNPTILRNGIPCGSSCHNFTPLTESTVIFKITSWSNYSIGSTPPLYISEMGQIYQNLTERSFFFAIKNGLFSQIENISWEFDTGESNESSTYNTTLEGQGDLFVYIEHNYSSGGNYTITARAQNQNYSAIRSINIEI